MLTREEKGLDQLTLSTNGHARKALEPMAFRHLGLGIEPLCQERQLGSRNLSALNSVEQVLEESGRDVLAADLRHGRR
jgi:hypothetical protein